MKKFTEIGLSDVHLQIVRSGAAMVAAVVGSHGDGRRQDAEARDRAAVLQKHRHDRSRPRSRRRLRGARQRSRFRRAGCSRQSGAALQHADARIMAPYGDGRDRRSAGRRTRARRADHLSRIQTAGSNIRTQLYPTSTNVPTFSMGMKDGMDFRDMVGTRRGQPVKVKVRLDVQLVPNQKTAHGVGHAAGHDRRNDLHPRPPRRLVRVGNRQRVRRRHDARARRVLRESAESPAAPNDRLPRHQRPSQQRATTAERISPSIATSCSRRPRC